MTSWNYNSQWIETFTGKRLWPLDPDPDAICIADIAHGLAGRFRFAGQSREWYTVAQHCVEVSRRVPAEDALWGLLHDAAEAYLPDITRPVKDAFYVELDRDETGHEVQHEIVSFGFIEDQLLDAVAARFGMRPPMPACVHTADDRELARERRDLFPRDRPAWDGLPDPYPEPLVPVSPSEAEAMFLNRFKDLTA